MTYQAKVYRVLIASPSDVNEEREIAVRTIQEWNDLNSASKQIVLLPIRWETHTSPEYGLRPQEAINRQIVDQSDCLIGIFWTKLGTPTGLKDSGTIEEIERVVSVGKPAMLYFSKSKAEIELIDLKQLEKLREFKARTYPNALVENFSNQVEFRDKLFRQLELQIRKFEASNEQDIEGEIQSTILLEFFDVQKKEHVPDEITVHSTFYNVVDIDQVPDFETKSKQKKSSTESFDLIIGKDQVNKDYYREVVKFFVANQLFYPCYFWLKNIGSLGAKDLFVSVRIKSEDSNLEIIQNSKFNKSEPRKTTNRFSETFIFSGGREDDYSELKKNRGW